MITPEQMQEIAGADEMSAEEFRSLRNSLSLTQKDLGAVFNMEQPSIARMERRGIRRGARVFRLAFKALQAANV